MIWEASGNRPQYVDAALDTLARNKIRTILDYGCGIGSDAIALQQNGFAVTGCDYHSPSTRFMHWRTGGSIPIGEPDSLGDTKPDALWIIDTIDHLTDPEHSLAPLLANVSVMVTENITATRKHGNQRFHHRRPINELTDLFQRYGLAPNISGTAVTIWTR